MSELKCDCGFDVENYHYRFRAGGLLINNGKILFVETKYGDYFYVAGGGVKLGESTESAIIREYTEETCINVKIDRLAVICENFFKGHGGILEGKDCHTLEFYYILSTDDDIGKIPEKTDDGENLIWIPIEEINSKNVKPNFIKQRIQEILKSKYPLHIIEATDRNN